MITLLVGDVTEYLALAAKKYWPAAQLINEHNCNKIVSGTYYTSLGDFSSRLQFVQTLEKADKLIYAPPDVWSDSDSKNFSYMKLYTEFHMLTFKNTKTVLGLNHLIPSNTIKTMLALTDYRKTEESQLWVAGCSITNGDFLDKDARYGQLLANKLNKQVSFLSRAGSSIGWAADQILRSDIRENDLVIFALTSVDRFTLFKDDNVINVNIGYYEKHPELNKLISIDLLHSENSMYQSMASVHQVINFCNKVKAKLLLIGMFVHKSDIFYFSSLPNYYHIHEYFGDSSYNQYLDFAVDGVHPGPLMHQWYADAIYKLL